MTNYYSNKAEFKSYRKRLRNNSTSAEAALWNLIKARKIEGRKFRRQHGFGNYIVDFYCSEEKLVIELDGDSHGDYSKIEQDIKRDEALRQKGIKVIRFENKLVFQDPEYVINEIKKQFNMNHLPPAYMPGYSSFEKEEK